MAAITISTAEHYLWVIPYMIFLGLHTGFAYTSLNALWAELYGLDHLGEIKSLHVSLTVFGSAFGPVIMGVLVDIGVSLETTCLIFATVALLSNVSIILALRLTSTPRH
jgi:MFS family permease